MIHWPANARQAVERTAPVAMLLYSLIVLWLADEGYKHNRTPNRPWYPQKNHASFADMLGMVNARVAERADRAILMVSGLPVVLKS